MTICPRCGKLLSTQQALEYHLKKKIPCNSLYRCGNCSKEFNSNEELLLHKRNCTMPHAKLSRIVKTQSFNNVYILDQQLAIAYCDDKSLVGKQFPSLYSKNTRDLLRDEIRKGMEPHLFMRHGAGEKSAYYLCAFPCGDRFVVLEKPLVPMNGPPGFLTP